MAYQRNVKKESEWEKKVYKRFVYRCRIDNGDFERLQAVLNGRPFADWVRKKLAEDEAQKRRECQGHDVSG